jgi:hypothetical protein
MKKPTDYGGIKKEAEIFRSKITTIRNDSSLAPAPAAGAAEAAGGHIG